MIWESRMWIICEGKLRDIIASVDPQRGTENGNCNGNTFFHEGPRRTAKNCNGNIFSPRRATKDREELQWQLLLSTEGSGGHGGAMGGGGRGRRLVRER